MCWRLLNPICRWHESKLYSYLNHHELRLLSLTKPAALTKAIYRLEQAKGAVSATHLLPLSLQHTTAVSPTHLLPLSLQHTYYRCLSNTPFHPPPPPPSLSLSLSRAGSLNMWIYRLEKAQGVALPLQELPAFFEPMIHLHLPALLVSAMACSRV